MNTLPLMKEASLWDYFAANALAGAAGTEASGCNTPRDLAHWAATLADSMLIERQRRADAQAAEHAARPKPVIPMPSPGR